MGVSMPIKSIKNLLEDFIKQGEFDYAFISDDSGLPLVCVGSNMPVSETQAALLSRIKNTIGMVDAHKGLGTIDEMVFSTSGKRKLIVHNFTINNKQLLLAASMESHRSYRRLTTTLIHQLQTKWDV
jgi:hypothetical protein